MWRRPVKHCHSAAVSSWCVRLNDAIPIQSAGVDYISDLCFLGDAQVHVVLVHPPQHRLQPPVTTVSDIVGAKPNRHRPPRKTPSTPTNPLTTDSFLTLAPADLPVCACLPLSLFSSPFHPCRPSLAVSVSVPVSVPVSVLPPFLLCAVHLGMR